MTPVKRKKGVQNLLKQMGDENDDWSCKKKGERKGCRFIL